MLLPILKFIMLAEFLFAAEPNLHLEVALHLRKAYDSQCNPPVSSNQIFKSDLSLQYPNYYEPTFFKLFGQANLSNSVVEILKLRSHTEDLNQTQRLNLANALIISRSDDISAIEMLADFRSQSPSYLANKKLIDAVAFGLREEWKSSLKEVVETVEVAPVLTVSMLSGLFFLDDRDPYQRQLVDRALIALKAKRASSVNLLLFDSALGFLAARTTLDSQAREKLLEAPYRACPNDPAIAELYAYELIQQTKDFESYAVLESVIKAGGYVSATSEFLFAKVNDRLEKFDVAKTFYEKVIDPKNIYVNKVDKQFARERLAFINQSHFNWFTNAYILFWFIPILLVAVVVAKMIARRSSRR